MFVKQIDIRNYTFKDLISFYQDNLQNLKKKEIQKLQHLLESDEPLNMYQPPKGITEDIIKRFAGGKDYKKNKSSDLYLSHWISVWQSLLLYAFNDHPTFSYTSYANNIIEIPPGLFMAEKEKKVQRNEKLSIQTDIPLSKKIELEMIPSIGTRARSKIKKKKFYLAKKRSSFLKLLILLKQ